LSEITTQLKNRVDIKGECTLLVAGCDRSKIQSWDVVREQIRTAVVHRRESLSEIAREIAAKTGMSKNKIYTQALIVKKEIKRE
jgi:16S rRNA (cytidine1402-2'-O)-methyltransferase